MADELEHVYRHLNELNGSLEPVRRLLRDIQARGEEQRKSIVLGKSKEEAIRNLRIAVDSKYAQINEVRELLWDLEESGKQHVLLFTPLKDSAAKLAADVVSVALFDDQQPSMLFPQYEHPASGYEWVDFRFGKGEGWVAKAYGTEVRKKPIGAPKTTVRNGVTTEVRKYEEKTVRSTLVARWQPTCRVLELRIDSTDQATHSIDERCSQLWKLLAPAFGKVDLKGMSIDEVLKALVFDRQQPANAELYCIWNVELVDPGSGMVRVLPVYHDDLDGNEGRTKSLAAMQENGFRPSHATVEWHPGQPGCPACMTEDLTTAIQKTPEGTELRIAKRVTRATYDYLLNQLFSRRKRR